MRHSLLSTTAACAVVAAVGLGPSAEASPSLSVAATVTPNPATSTGGDWIGQQVSVSTFDVPGGHLQSILVFENLTANYSGQVTLSSAAGSFSGTLHAETDLGITGGPSVLDGAPALSVTGSGYVFATPTTAGSFSSPGNSGSPGSMTYGDLADWESTVVGPNTTITLGSNSYVVTGVSGMIFDPLPTLAFTLNVTYNYTTGSPTGATSAPEPASALMVGSGLLALGAARRRRKC